ncbi:hypothetical protein B0J12DRAFT_695256 [Macrophomina phaseolina]|uniref:Rhodopsin domain-containing protein n=1 Tax=Macrophomina phaseolina TaxID=35725 RepID=A0ABQ8GMT5_9PEZI|nr:hypothetical protein B0J12DRAFT_695256 [Macrophomina phaseolina]
MAVGSMRLETSHAEWSSSPTPSLSFLPPSSTAVKSTTETAENNPFHSHDSSRGPSIAYTSAILYASALVFVALRLHVRCCISKTHGADDYLIIVATLLMTLGTVFMLMQVAYGWGKHTSKLTLEQLNKSQMYFINISSTIHESVCCLILRMMRGATTFGKECRAVIWAVMVFILMRLMVDVVCVPVDRFWQMQLRPEGCVNIMLWSSVASFLNSFTDLILFLLPIPLVYKHRIHVQQKLAVCIIFIAGLIPIAASLIRSTHLTQSYIDMGTLLEKNPSWHVASILVLTHHPSLTLHRRWAFVPFWYQLEITIGVIAACMPTLSPLLKALFRRLGLRCASFPTTQKRLSRAPTITTASTTSTGNSSRRNNPPHHRRCSSHPGTGARSLSADLAALNMLDLEDIFPSPSSPYLPHANNGSDCDGLDDYFRTHARLRMDGPSGREQRRTSSSSAPAFVGSMAARYTPQQPPPPSPRERGMVRQVPVVWCTHEWGGTDARDFGAAEARGQNEEVEGGGGGGGGGGYRTGMVPRCAGAAPPAVTQEVGVGDRRGGSGDGIGHGVVAMGRCRPGEKRKPGQGGNGIISEGV